MYTKDIVCLQSVNQTIKQIKPSNQQMNQSITASNFGTNRRKNDSSVCNAKVKFLSAHHLLSLQHQAREIERESDKTM